jgi:hypothetical protein
MRKDQAKALKIVSCGKRWGQHDHRIPETHKQRAAHIIRDAESRRATAPKLIAQFSAHF